MIAVTSHGEDLKGRSSVFSSCKIFSIICSSSEYFAVTYFMGCAVVGRVWKSVTWVLL